jgi:diphthamide synthase (EF-2-diphthine--ammonia ligase)
MPEPLILSWSGGKDSTLALDALRASGRHGPIVLLTSVTAGYDRVSIHGVRRELLRAQAAALGLPLHELELHPESSNEAYDAALATALQEVRGQCGARRVAFGDLFLEDVRRYREARVAALGFEPLFPLWGRDTAALAREFVDRGFRARLVCVDTTRLGAGFAAAPTTHGSWPTCRRRWTRAARTASSTPSSAAGRASRRPSSTRWARW